MKRADVTCLLRLVILALMPLNVLSADVPEVLTGTWEVDVESSTKAAHELKSGTRITAGTVFHHVTFLITNNTFSIIAPYPEMSIPGVKKWPCLVSACAPARVTFGKTNRNGNVSHQFSVSALPGTTIRLGAAPDIFDFLCAYIWRRRSSNKQIQNIATNAPNPDL